MTTHPAPLAPRGPRRQGWRLAGWGGAVTLLLLPAVAMRYTGEVAWDAADFVAAGLLLAALGGGLELAARLSADAAYRAGAALALGISLLMVWANAAVGLIGDPDHPGNAMFPAVVGVALLGALLARGRAGALVRAMAAAAVAQGLAAGIALVAGWPLPLAATLAFGLLWLAAALLFRRAAARDAAPR